jgi:hypothetical protein
MYLSIYLYVGTWESFYKNFYSVVLTATGKGNIIPIFLRFYSSNYYWKPYWLDTNVTVEIKHNIVKKIQIKKSLCFERVIKRAKTASFYNRYYLSN